MFKVCFSSGVQRDEEEGKGGLKHMTFFRRKVGAWGGGGGAAQNGGGGFFFLWALKEWRTPIFEGGTGTLQGT